MTNTALGALFIARAILIGLIWLCGFAVSGAIVFYLFVCSHDLMREIWRRAVSDCREDTLI